MHWLDYPYSQLLMLLSTMRKITYFFEAVDVLSRLKVWPQRTLDCTRGASNFCVSCLYTHYFCTAHFFFFHFIHCMWYLLMLISRLCLSSDVYLQLPPCNFLGYLHCIPGMYVPSGGMCCLVIKAVSVDYYIIGISVRLSCGQCLHRWGPMLGASVAKLQ